MVQGVLFSYRGVAGIGDHIKGSHGDDLVGLYVCRVYRFIAPHVGDVEGREGVDAEVREEPAGKGREAGHVIK